MGGESFCQRVVLHHQRLTPRGRQPGLMDQLDEPQAGQRCARRRLDNDRAPGGDCRNHLVHDQVQRMVECGNGGDHTDRFLDGERPAVPARRRQPHRNFAPGQMLQFADGTLTR